MVKKNISVIGLGYIGLPTAAMLASKKQKITGVDVNKRIVDFVNNGKSHFQEPDLEAYISSAVSEGFLFAKTTPVMSDVFIIAVPTPFKKTKKTIPEPDLQFIYSAAESIAPFLKPGNLVVIESTCPVGTTEKVSKYLSKIREDLIFPHDDEDNSDIFIAYCPERVLPGKIVKELICNDRIIGGISKKCSLKALELYKIFVKGNIVTTNSRTAEMVKLTENSSRDVQIAFANELSIICDNLDINVWEMISLANMHPRVNILQPGPGVGGHCIAVDPWFIVHDNPRDARIIHTARLVNDQKPTWVIKKVKEAITELTATNPQKKQKDLVVTCLGLTFKPDIDDLRESPALEIAKSIAKFHSGHVLAVEPNIQSLPDSCKDFTLVSLHEAKKITDIYVLLVDHSQFKEKKLYGKIIDTKGIMQ